MSALDYTGKNCVCCGEEISQDNVFTKAGEAEVRISGMCEVCFDVITFTDYCWWKLDKEIIDLVKNTDHLVLAGGALRAIVDPMRENICDYDLFVTDVSMIDDVKENLVNLGYNLVFSCPEGKLFTYKKGDVKVQIINNRPYKDCLDIIDSFDITASCAAWDGDNIVKNRRFIGDVLNKKIHINTVEYPKATLNRIIKYVGKGYSLTRGGNSKYVEAVAEMVIDDINGRFYID